VPTLLPLKQAWQYLNKVATQLMLRSQQAQQWLLLRRIFAEWVATYLR
jgi:hypothetical protein